MELTDFDPPAIRLVGQEPVAAKGLTAILRDPAQHWPPALLERPFVEGRAGKSRIALIASPQVIDEMLRDRAGRFPRSRLHDRMLGMGYGENLLRGMQSDVRKQRREIAQPLNLPSASNPVPRILGACDRIVREWRSSRAPVNVLRDARRFALDALWRCFFCDEEQAASAEPLAETAASAIDAQREPSLSGQLAELLPLARLSLRRLGPAVDHHDETHDLNAMLLFLSVGHDNVAATLSWALWLLANDQELQSRIREEWRAAPARERPDGVDLAAYAMTGAVVREALRLYPPVLHLAREAAIDVEVEGERIAAGFTAVLSIYAMHRNRLWWDEPDAFRPERFLGDAGRARSQALWLPYGIGPRGCIGAGFAQVELVVALGAILSAVELTPNSGRALACRAEWVLRPEGRDVLLARPLPVMFRS